MLPESALADHLDQARQVFACTLACPEDGTTGWGVEAEALRWFPLPEACVRPDHAGSARGAGV